MSHPPRLLVVVVGLALGLSVLAAPADAATERLPAETFRPSSSQTTTISGFPRTKMRVRSRQKVSFKISVNDRTKARRSVRLQKRVSGRWRTVVKGRTNRSGSLRLKWRAPKRAQTVRLRVVVPRSGRISRAVTRARKVVITAQKPAGKQSLADRYEAEVFVLVNKARARARTCGDTRYPAVAKLTRHASLDRAARKYAQRMAVEGFFSHTSPDGDDPTDRARAEGYRGGVGENIAAGYSTPATVMQGWLDSPGHCANLMSPGYDDIGIGFALPPPDRPARYSNYWVQNFG